MKIMDSHMSCNDHKSRAEENSKGGAITSGDITRGETTMNIKPASILLVAFLCSTGCSSIPCTTGTKQYIRIENQNQSRVRAYVAFETSAQVRVLLGTIEPYKSEEFPIPNGLSGHRGLVIYCENGPRGQYLSEREFFETSFVPLPGFSTIVVTVRDPIRYSDYRIYASE
jgi:hypothetical protein